MCIHLYVFLVSMFVSNSHIFVYFKTFSVLAAGGIEVN